MSRLTIPAGAKAIYHYGGWTLYELPPRAGDSILWQPFRLMLPPDTPAHWRMSRSFSLAWNPLALRFRGDKARVELAALHPDLYERVELTLSLSYGREWLRDVRGITDAEIQAERVRLAAMARARRTAKARPVAVFPWPFLRACA